MDLGDEVEEGTPAAFQSFPKDAPRNRLGFAEWLMSRENPLTARVVANRFWEQIFGTGLVRTSEEFGTQGELPTHPELLDWLAVELQTDYREAVPQAPRDVRCLSAVREGHPRTRREGPGEPPARGDRARLSAEMVRDQALHAAGLLSKKMLGPSVKPPQPNLGVNAAFGGAIDWQPSPGEDRYRRGIYTMWRLEPVPVDVHLRCPQPRHLHVRRTRTNTPLQAARDDERPGLCRGRSAGPARWRRAAPPRRRRRFAAAACLIRPPSEKEVGATRQTLRGCESEVCREVEKRGSSPPPCWGYPRA